jgi:hypothetical protein
VVLINNGLSFSRLQLPDADPLNFLSTLACPHARRRRPLRFPVSAGNVDGSDVPAARGAGWSSGKADTFRRKKYHCQRDTGLVRRVSRAGQVAGPALSTLLGGPANP